MKKQRKIFNRIYVTIAILTFIGLVGHNIFNNEHFWDASAVNCITMGIAVLVSFYFVQRKNDRRKQKDIILDMIVKMQARLENESMYDLHNQRKEEILMRNRDIRNRISILEGIKDDFDISAEIDFVIARFDEYTVFCGESSGPVHGRR